MSSRESRPAPAAQAARRRRRQPDRRPALLAALRDAGRPLDVAEAAAAIGTAESTARFHLSLLVSAGQVRRTALRGGSAGRPAWRYEPAPPVDAPSGAYRELARVLAERLEGEAGAAVAAREAGRRWAATLPDLRPAAAEDADGAVTSLVQALGALGFAPEASPPADEIVLHACPFADVAREHRAVVCGVHLGLVEKAAEAIGGGLAVEALEPFRTEQPLTCAVRLRRAGKS